MHPIPDSFIRAVCWTLLHSLWQGLIFALVAGIIMVLTKKASSARRYQLLCGLMTLFLVVCGITFYRELQPAAHLANIISPPRQDIPASTTQTTTPTTISPATLTQNTSYNLGIAIDSLVRYFNTHASLLVLIWFIFFLTRFVKVLSGLVYAQRIRHHKTSPVSPEWQAKLGQLIERLQLTRPVTLLESALVRMPTVVGALKPVILVPMGMITNLSPAQVESILLHELAHIRRRDYLLNLVQHIIDTIFFFNPALVWVSSLIRAERENCCDDIAIRETRSRRRLIEALVSWHDYERTANGFALGFADNENAVVKRVKRIVHQKNHGLQAGERALLMGGLLVLSAAFVTIKGANHDQPNTQTLAAMTTPVVAHQNTSKTKTFPASQPSSVTHRSQQPKPQTSLTVRPDTTLPNEPKDTIDVDLLIRAREHGVTDEYVQELKDLGYKPVHLEKAIDLVDHGVTIEFIRDLRKLGYTDLSLDKAIRLVDHGVTVDFIKEIHDAGFPSITLEKVVKLMDHGVTADFINGWKKKTGTLLQLDDYIKLHDVGIEP